MSNRVKVPLIPPPPSSVAISAVMRGNRSRDTKPEIYVRRLLFAEGYRYRIHLKELPGRPDIAFIGRKKAIFVHGCFWHQHPDTMCPLRSHPKSNIGYWSGKLQKNRERDVIAERQLCNLGWHILVVWECETRDLTKLRKKLRT